MRGATAMLVGSLVLVACRSTPQARVEPRVRTDPASPTIDAKGVCEGACAQVRECVPELQVELASEALGPAPEAPECSELCAPFAPAEDEDGAATYARVQVAEALAACATLDACPAVWSCAWHEPTRAWLARAAPVMDRSCDALCARVGSCTEPCDPETGNCDEAAEDDEATEATLDEHPVELRDDEAACRADCAKTNPEGPARAALLDCGAALDCHELDACWRQWGAQDWGDRDRRPPGVGDICASVCSRAIDCGVEGYGLSKSQQDAVRDAMTSTWVECAVQCEADLNPKNRAKFEACVASDDCGAFEDCSDDL